MKVGYVRVSTEDQQLDLQLDAMQEVKCEKVFQDVMSGAKTDRPGLKEALNYVREGDILVVWKLDRLGRSLPHLIEVITQLDARGVGFICLTQNLDTTTPGGRLIFHIFGAIAQFERELIRERTMAGLQSARARGRFGGRPRLLSAAKIKLLRSMHADPSNSVTHICEVLGIARATFYAYLKETQHEQ
jgi:DNA invertase Pin-like site-specific DNA recombinase